MGSSAFRLQSSAICVHRSRCCARRKIIKQTSTRLNVYDELEIRESTEWIDEFLNCIAIKCCTKSNEYKTKKKVKRLSLTRVWMEIVSTCATESIYVHRIRVSQLHSCVFISGHLALWKVEGNSAWNFTKSSLTRENRWRCAKVIATWRKWRWFEW